MKSKSTKPGSPTSKEKISEPLTDAQIAHYASLSPDELSPSVILMFPGKGGQKSEEIQKPPKNKGGRPRKLNKGDPGKVLSSFFAASAAQQIAERATADGITVSEWLKLAASEKLERYPDPKGS